MQIDLEGLKVERTIDPFLLPPIVIQESLATVANASLDKAPANLEVSLGDAGGTLCRVLAFSPSPRLRQLLAILGWAPLDPASDDVWCLDEPVHLPRDAYATAVELIGRCYAEAMNALFAPGDGVFEGGAVAIEKAIATADVRDLLKRMAERRHVSRAIAACRCPTTILHQALSMDVAQYNHARGRAGLPRLTCPAPSTVQRWSVGFNAAHAGRKGTGRDFVNHRPLSR